MSSSVTSIDKGAPFDSDPAVTLNRSTKGEVVLFAIVKSGVPRSWLGVSAGLKLKKLKKKSLANRSLPESLVTWVILGAEDGAWLNELLPRR